MSVYSTIQYSRWATLCLAILLVLTCRQQGDFGKEPVKPFAGVDTAQVDSVLAALTLEEKIGQLIVWQANLQDSASQIQVLPVVRSGRVGGLMLEKLPLDTFLALSDNCRKASGLPLFFGTDESVSLHNLFSDIPHFPLSASLGAVDSTSLHRLLEEHYWKQCKALGINFSLNPVLKFDDPAAQSFDFQTFENDPAALLERSKAMALRLRQHRILAVGDEFSTFSFVQNDTLRDSILHRYKIHTWAGLPGLLVSDKVFQEDTLKTLPPRFVKNYLNNYLEFNGLTVARLAADESPEKKIMQGADLVITENAEKTYARLFKMVELGKLSELDLDKKVRLILKAKAWTCGGRLPVKISQPPKDAAGQPGIFVSGEAFQSASLVENREAPLFDALLSDEIRCYFQDENWSHFIRLLFEHSVVLAHDPNRLVPFGNLLESDFSIVELSARPMSEFKRYFSKYANFNSIAMKPAAPGDLPKIKLDKTSDSTVAVILLDSIDLQPGFHKPFISSINELSKSVKTVLVNFGNPKNLHHFETTITAVQIFERNSFTEAYTAQLLFGGVPSLGRMPVEVSENLPFGAAVHNQPVRLGFTIPEKTGIAAERLVGIDAIAESAIDHGVFPGCQVAVAKDGKVIFSKAFGSHTYSKKSRVRKADLYDIASVTKIAATTLAAMKLYENKQLDLKCEVGSYLSLDEKSMIKNLKIRELLLHHTGLQAQMPIAKYYNWRNVPVKGCNDFFCKKKREHFNVPVTGSLFLRENYPDSIWKRVFRLPVSSRKYFHYSDVNYFILQKTVETVSKTPLDDYVFENLYRPLGLRRTTYKPMERFEKWEIVPSENDRYWRKELVHGYVHDPAVALMGGVGGSAGVFSNAEDLTVLFQMLLNEGTYGGVQFFQPETIKEFTSGNHGNHRGYGFDKPANRRFPTYSRHASPETYGHTGFTGTCVWVDPKQKLVYVFLSNRIHPSARNGKIFTEAVRSRIHNVVYDAFGTFQLSLPALNVKEEVMEGE